MYKGILAIILPALFLLAGCSSLLSPLPDKPSTTYIINTVNPDTIHARKTDHTLLVTTPLSNPSYSSNSIVYVVRPFELNAFAKSRWIEPPAQMLTPLLVRSLQNTGHFKAVIASPFAGQTDFRLDTQLISLQQDFLQKPSRVRVAITAQLIRTSTQEVIASKRFETVAIAPCDNPYGGVVAANRAVATLLQQITEFTVLKS